MCAIRPSQQKATWQGTRRFTERRQAFAPSVTIPSHNSSTWNITCRSMPVRTSSCTTAPRPYWRQRSGSARWSRWVECSWIAASVVVVATLCRVCIPICWGLYHLIAVALCISRYVHFLPARSYKCASHRLRTTNCPWLGRGQVMWPTTKYWGSNHITGTAEPKVIKFGTRVGNINSMQQDDISPTKGRGYAMVTWLF